jgi:hypothetical protein
MNFVRMFDGYPQDVQKEINNSISTEHLDVVEISSFAYGNGVCVTVVFKTQDND